MRNKLLVSLVLAVVLFVSAAVAVGAVELTVWVVRDNYQIDLTDWYAENPDIKINYEVIPWERTLDQLILAASSRRAPDIAVLDSPWVPVLAGLGHLRPMEGYLDTYWTEEEIADFFPISWDFATYEDTIYGVPFTLFSRFLFYRADWFAEAGIPEPITWDDVIAAGQHFHNPSENIIGLTIRGRRDDGSVQGFLPIFSSFGGEFIDEVPQIDSEAGIAALQLLQDMVWTHKVMSEDTVMFGSGEARGAFISGNAAMGIIESHIAHAVEAGGTHYPDFKLAPIPRVNEGDVFPNLPTGFHWTIHAQSDHPEEAAKFINYVSGPGPSAVFNSAYMESVRYSTYDMEFYQEAKPWMDTVLADMENVVPLPRLPQYTAISQAIQMAMQDMLRSPDTDAATAAATAQVEINRAMGIQ